MTLTRDEILAVPDLAKVEVEVPEWGGRKVYIREMTGIERDLFEQHPAVRRSASDTATDTDRASLRTVIVVMTACDQDGVLLFSPADAPAVGGKNWRALNALAAAAMRLNALGETALRSAEGNSDADRSGGSISD